MKLMPRKLLRWSNALPGTAGLSRLCGIACSQDARQARYRLILQSGGYCLSQASGHEIGILNLVIDPGYQHRGLARHLIGDLIERGLNSETDVVFLEVRRSNARARRLYTGMGFKQVGTRRGYYVGSPESEDALVMRRKLGRAGAIQTV